MSYPDARGNPCSSICRPALAAAEQALWRMMSFYDTPLADLDEAIAADPGWLLPHVMKAGFLLGLTEPGLARDRPLAAPLGLERRVQVFERLLGRGGLDASRYCDAVGRSLATLHGHV
jgi:hypothetical protein